MVPFSSAIRDQQMRMQANWMGHSGAVDAGMCCAVRIGVRVGSDTGVLPWT